MFYWDPDPEFLIIPYLNLPILWYGVLFALGFSIAIPIWASLAKRFFLNNPKYTEKDILAPIFLQSLGSSCSDVKNSLNRSLEGFDLELSTKQELRYIKRYSFFSSHDALARLGLDRIYEKGVLSVAKKVSIVGDQLVVYIAVGAIAGARLFHLFFYEDPSFYLDNLAVIFKVREGGLASHGGFVGVFLACLVFSHRVKKIASGMFFFNLLDLLSVPACLVGVFIRMGNFMNQEILGRATDLPWGVTFGHPMDLSRSIPRHPVQLYEAFYYLLCFFILWQVAKKAKHLMNAGFLSGLFLILVFGFRFFVEFVKEEQSFLLQKGVCLTMGQYLSLPLIFLGFFLFFRARRKLV